MTCAAGFRVSQPRLPQPGCRIRETGCNTSTAVVLLPNRNCNFAKIFDDDATANIARNLRQHDQIMTELGLSSSNLKAGMEFSAHTDSEETASSVFADSAVDIEMAGSSTQADGQLAEPDPTVFEVTDENVGHYSDQTAPKSLSPISQSLSDKMRQLTAAAWALEQDDEMSDSRRAKIGAILKDLEKTIEDDGSSQAGDNNNDNIVSEEHGAGVEQSRSHTQSESDSAEQEAHHPEDKAKEHDYIDESDLHVIHDSLRQTVSSMRLRYQEQKHLHQLTVQKLETMAQHYLAQEQEMRIQAQRVQDLLSEMANLRSENQTLGRDNDQLRNTVGILEAESTRKEVAVSAMTSAVAGLEGWIESAAGTPTAATGRARTATATPTRQSRFMSASKSTDQKNNNHRHQQQQQQQQQQQPKHQTPLNQYTPLRNHQQAAQTQTNRSVIKGRGRFRGRYYIDDEQDSNNEERNGRSESHNDDDDNMTMMISNYDTQDLQDGVRAWIRGFRDVEECANLGPQHRLSYSSYQDQAKHEDEWGEFQSPERNGVR